MRRLKALPLIMRKILECMGKMPFESSNDRIMEKEIHLFYYPQTSWGLSKMGKNEMYPFVI